LEQQDFANVMADLDNNQDPISDMMAYQTACLNRINDLEEENQEAMASLQANPAAWPEVSTTITTNLTTIQGILNEESTLQQLYAIKAQQNGDNWSNVATPTPTSGKPPGNENFVAPSPTPTGSIPAPTPTSTPAPTSGTELNTTNTTYPTVPGPGPIPVSAVQFNPDFGSSANGSTIENYINQALNAMGITNPTARQNWMTGLLTAAHRESGLDNANDYKDNNDDPDAVNASDGNAVGATESDNAPAGSSRGLLQVTPTVFAEFHQPGTSDNIYNPVANIAASMNYVMARYGVNQDGSNLGIVQQFNSSFPAHGY
jgi:hypothetical protein